MATKTHVELIDDLTGEPADETVDFALDGIAMQVDLTEANARALRNALSDYIEAARRVPRARASGRAARGGGTAPATVDREQNRQVREWARRQGYEISERGRIPSHVSEAYQQRAGRGGLSVA